MLALCDAPAAKGPARDTLRSRSRCWRPRWHRALPSRSASGRPELTLRRAMSSRAGSWACLRTPRRLRSARFHPACPASGRGRDRSRRRGRRIRLSGRSFPDRWTRRRSPVGSAPAAARRRRRASPGRSIHGSRRRLRRACAPAGSSRPLPKAHLRRWLGTVLSATYSRVRLGRRSFAASHLDLFERPARLFSILLVPCQRVAARSLSQ